MTPHGRRLVQAILTGWPKASQQLETGIGNQRPSWPLPHSPLCPGSWRALSWWILQQSSCRKSSACFSSPPLAPCLFTGCAGQAVVTFPGKSHSILRKSKGFKILIMNSHLYVLIGLSTLRTMHVISIVSKHERKKKAKKKNGMDLLPSGPSSSIPIASCIPRRKAGNSVSLSENTFLRVDVAHYQCHLVDIGVTFGGACPGAGEVLVMK